MSFAREFGGMWLGLALALLAGRCAARCPTVQSAGDEL